MATPRSLQILSRCLAALVGGWGFTAGLVVFGAAALVATGLPYAEAQTAMYLVAFVVWLGVICWTFAVRRVASAWLVLLGGATVLGGAGLWIARGLVSAGNGAGGGA
jgi:hypothetical protein